MSGCRTLDQVQGRLCGGVAIPGSDLDDEACCPACHDANLAGAFLRPLASLTRDVQRTRAGVDRVWAHLARQVAAEGGREARG